MLENLRKRSKDESGFTLVELLVVMLILGILAAIAVPSFFNQRNKATDAQAKADVRTAQTAIESFATDNQGEYLDQNTSATPVPQDLANVESSLQEAVDDGRLSITSDATSYTVQVTSENGGGTQLFRIARASDGVTSLTCDVGGTDGCPNGGVWG